MATLEVFIPGIPAPQGSKKSIGNNRFIESSKKVGPWRIAVKKAIDEHGPFERFTGALEVWSVYYLPRPSTVKRLLPTVPPDLDKLDRGLWDALTKAEVWDDDSLVVGGGHAKRYAPKGKQTGAMVRITSLDENLLDL